MLIFIIQKGNLMIRKSKDQTKVMWLGRIIALALWSDPMLHLKDGHPHLLTLLGLGEGTLRLMFGRGQGTEGRI